MTEQANYVITLQDRFTSPLSKMESHLNRFESKIGGIGTVLAGVFGGSLLAGGASSLLNGVKELGLGIIKLGADMEQTRISFTTMLGSAERANNTIAKLVKFSEVTPFAQDEVITGAKQLLAYGFAAENLTTDLTRLGDVSAGLSIPLGDLVYLYGTIRTQGRAMTKDLMQFANRGIPIYDNLAKITGKSGMALQKMVEDGEIGFSTIEKAFIEMTKKGSMFGGLMEKQSKSLAGRWATLTDKIKVMGTTIGESWIPALGRAVEKLISIVDLIPKLDFKPITKNWEQIIYQFGLFYDQVTKLIGAFGIATSEFDNATIALKYFAFMMRVAGTPLRVVIALWTELMTLIINSVDVFKGLGTVFEGIFTRDFTKMAVGIAGIEQGFKKLTDESVKMAKELIDQEKQGWSAIFEKWEDPTKAGQGSGSSGGGAFGARGGSATKANEAGVERIKSGTRNVTLNISQLVGEIKFEKSIEKSEAQMVDLVKRVLLTAVNDVNIVAQ